MDFPYGTTVTVRSITTTDDGLGNTVTVPVDRDWGPCAIAPRYSRESTDPNVPPVVVGSMVYGPPSEDPIDSDDVIVIAGVEYEVDGLPEDYTGAGRNPFTGWEPGLAVPVKRTGSV